MNAGRIPKSRFRELLHVNFFDNNSSFTEDGQEIQITTSRTFLGYALPKIVDLEAFLTTLQKRLEDKEFDSYMNTPNYLCTEIKVSVDDLYLKDHGAINSEERAALSDDNKKILQNLLPEKQTGIRIDNVDTHNLASHKTGDESHVTAFRIMVETNGLTINANYEAPSKAGNPSRKITITNKGNLDQFVTA